MERYLSLWPRGEWPNRAVFSLILGCCQAHQSFCREQKDVLETINSLKVTVYAFWKAQEVTCLDRCIEHGLAFWSSTIIRLA